MKKIVMILTFIMLLCGQTLSVHAEEKAVYSDGYFYYHLEDGYVSICGYFGKEEEVVIPSKIIALPVSRIEAGTFDGCDTAKKVILPDTIMEVQEGAFTGAAQLDTVENAAGENKPEYVEDAADENESEAVKDTSENVKDASNSGPEQNTAANAGMDNQSTSKKASTDSQNMLQSDGAGEDQYIEPEDDSQSALENEKNLQMIEDVLSSTNNPVDEVKVDEKGRLVAVDANGNETIIDDTKTYTQKEDGTIVDEDGNTVLTKEQETALTRQQEKEAKETRDWKITIGIGAAILVVIIGAVFLFWKKKRKR